MSSPVLLLLIASLLPPVFLLTPELGRTTEVLYIANSGGDDVNVVEVPGHRVIGNIKVGKHDADGLAASRTGDRLYVTVVDPASVVAIDTATDKVLWRVPVSPRPNLPSVSGDGRYVYVPIFSSDHVEVIDTQKQSVVAKIRVGSHPHNTIANSDGKRIYATAALQNQVVVIDVATQKITEIIPCGDQVRPIAVTRDEKRMYVQFSGLHGVAIADLTHRDEADPFIGKIVETIHHPALAEGVKPAVHNTLSHGLALSPDEKYLGSVSVVADHVAFFSVPDHKLVTTVAVGKAPRWITFSSDGKFAYVSNTGSNDVSAISMETLQEVVRIPAGKEPKRILTVVVPNRQVSKAN
ncbi:MAG TPA: beta-propeller fold lactonase family protein [Pyrinomonadaceae bacterium]|nr:beta-propeller fold lactonase family protein [Pyrinomonadaceae bacterium]